jgi:hypothetical protein
MCAGFEVKTFSLIWDFFPNNLFYSFLIAVFGHVKVLWLLLECSLLIDIQLDIVIQVCSYVLCLDFVEVSRLQQNVRRILDIIGRKLESE